MARYPSQADLSLSSWCSSSSCIRSHIRITQRALNNTHCWGASWRLWLCRYGVKNGRYIYIFFSRSFWSSKSKNMYSETAGVRCEKGGAAYQGLWKQTLGQRSAYRKFTKAWSWNQYPSGRGKIWQKEKLGHETSMKKASDNSKESFGSTVALHICPK